MNFVSCMILKQFKSFYSSANTAKLFHTHQGKLCMLSMFCNNIHIRSKPDSGSSKANKFGFLPACQASEPHHDFAISRCPFSSRSLRPVPPHPPQPPVCRLLQWSAAARPERSSHAAACAANSLCPARSEMCSLQQLNRTAGWKLKITRKWERNSLSLPVLTSVQMHAGFIICQHFLEAPPHPSHDCATMR